MSGRGSSRGGRGGSSGLAPRGGNSDRGSDRGRGRGYGDDSGFRGGRGRGRGGGGRGGPGGAASQGPLLFSPDGPILPPSKDVTRTEDELIANQSGPSLSSLTITTGSNLPPRPAYGTMGRSTVFRTNHFEIITEPDLQLFRYSVEVTPELKIARKRRRAFQLLLDTASFLDAVRPAVSTDHASMLITRQRLNLGPDDRTTIPIVYYETEEAGPTPEHSTTYIFNISYIKTLSVPNLMSYLASTDPAITYSDEDSILQALNVAMSRKPSASVDMAVFPRANKFFPIAAFLGDLGGGLIALRGYYTSVRTATLRLLVNVNSVTASFYRPGPLLELMRDFKSSCRGSWQKLLPKFLTSLRVQTTHLRTSKGDYKTKVVAGLARDPHPGANAQEVSFYWDKIKANLTVEQYYHRKYNIRLMSPQAPVVNVGNAQYPMWMPPELCIVMPGQVAKKVLSPEQTQEMIKVACRRPAANAALIVGEGAQVMGIGPQHRDGTALFGLQIAPQMLTVPGRILAPPTVSYGANKSVSPSSGSWNMIQQKFSKGAQIANWSFFKIRYHDKDPLGTTLPDLMKEFRVMMQTCGLRVDAPNPAQGFPDLILNPSQPDTHDGAVDRWLSNVRNTSKTKMLLIVLPTKSQTLYATIKYLGDVKYGLATVCCVATKLQTERGRSQYLANVALKWNLKCGGINQQIPSNKLGILSTSKTMVVGIDVTHPSPGSRKGAPSVAGVVASIDNMYGQWPASVQCQESRKEMVSGLEEMIIERLKLWRKHNGQALPQNILVYRDGVSEGQYQTVLNEESPAFDSAIVKIYPANGPKPKVSIIIVGKRHHTRFYPTKEEDADKSGNPKNGTVVDRGVTSERYWDFFLQAHTGLQGTARPAHYVVVQDQIGLGADGLEQLTHNLCYLFGRATKAVSICPPAYYADLLCERARCYLYDTFNQDSASSAGGAFDLSSARWTRNVHPDLKDTMFYI